MYLLSKSSPALLEQLEKSVLRELIPLRGKKRFEDEQAFLQVAPWLLFRTISVAARECITL